MAILNLTQHTASTEQILDSVVDLPTEHREVLSSLLTFNTLPDAATIQHVADKIADIAQSHGATQAMIGGAMWLVGPLTDTLRARGISPLFSFSQRKSEESIQSDGSTRKVVVFQHIGFVTPV